MAEQCNAGYRDICGEAGAITEIGVTDASGATTATGAAPEPETPEPAQTAATPGVSATVVEHHHPFALNNTVYRDG